MTNVYKEDFFMANIKDNILNVLSFQEKLQLMQDHFN